jgi:hypothetical protein
VNDFGLVHYLIVQFYIFCGVVIVSAFHVFHLQKLNRYVHDAGHVRHLKAGPGYSLAPIAFTFVAIAVLTVLHVVNCVIWGGLMWAAGGFAALSDSVFFAFENYTALGLTRVEIAWPWRYFAPAICFTGVLCFAWTGAILAAMFVRIYGASDKAPDARADQ